MAVLRHLCAYDKQERRLNSGMIIGVAVKFATGQEVRLPRPNRHADCMLYAERKLGIKIVAAIPADNQGFYTDTGEFLTRKEAMTHVRSIGQALLPDSMTQEINRSDYLFSEDVW